jgi:O-succinylbenzoate synthase
MRLELIHLRLPLVHFFETSFGRVHENETLLVRLEEDGCVGWGECPAGAAPHYSYETVETARYVIAGFWRPEGFGNVRGHPMAKAGVEMALWDLRARKEGRPLRELYGGTRDEIESGVSLGIEERPDDLLARVAEARERGYRRVKVKIKPGWDLDVIEKIRERFPALPLMADANAAYTTADFAHLAKLDAFNLTMLEQPLDHDDLFDHAQLARAMRTPICLDESVKSPADARHALEIGACRIINIKQARVGGPARARQIHDIAREAGAPVWCGGLLESGIGRAHNVALASLPNFTLPGDVSASDRYYREDVIDPPFRLTERGTLSVPRGPGIGVEVREDVIARYTVRRERVL